MANPKGKAAPSKEAVEAAAAMSVEAEQVEAAPAVAPTEDQAALLARIAELEATNDALAKAAVATAPQSRDAVMKNDTSPVMVQKLDSGNVRRTYDPSKQFVEEAAVSGIEEA